MRFSLHHYVVCDFWSYPLCQQIDTSDCIPWDIVNQSVKLSIPFYQLSKSRMYQSLVPYSDYLHEMVCKLRKHFCFWRNKFQVCVIVENESPKKEGDASSYPLDKAGSGCSHNFNKLLNSQESEMDVGENIKIM